MSKNLPRNLRKSSPKNIPSSSDTGFFQEPPRIPNQFYDDRILQRVLKLYIPDKLIPSLTSDLSAFGDRVLEPQVFSWIADAERNTPYLRTWDVFGRRRDELVTSEGWRNLQALGIREGIVAIAYEQQWNSYARVYQMLKYHLWSASSAYVICPSAMTDGAARLLARNIARNGGDVKDREVLKRAYEHLVSRDPEFAWTSGQWMTERSGGSDVRNTETQATLVPSDASSSLHSETDASGAPLGPYSITGFKWFSSATDANMTVLLARDPLGSISAFYAPLRRKIHAPLSTSSRALPLGTEPNGVQIQRLKTKLGTRALPTAELVLNDMRAWLLGPEGHGTREIATVLNITRAHNCVTAVGLWGRGLAISRAFSRVRKVGGGRLLMDVPSHVRNLANTSVEYAGMMHLTYFVVLLLGDVEHTEFHRSKSGFDTSPPILGVLDTQQTTLLLRLLTPVAKAVTALASIAGLSSLLESLGGVGYIDDPADPETNIARLLRDAQVLSIWEGTTEVMAADVVRVLKGREATAVTNALGEWARRRIRSWSSNLDGIAATKEVTSLVERAEERLTPALEKIEAWVKDMNSEQLMYEGRNLLNALAWLVSGVLLIEDATRDESEAMIHIAQRWLGKKDTRALRCSVDLDLGRNHALDQKIVFGDSIKTSNLASKL
ncbi:MAG: hypothetical protein M1821_007070 [Bathelium mastoideum]|nr:MAG: hypothetical protein M1821_007070 [Bathelium mastoideum]